MSLILEALKKSEQQRRLGEAPTLGSVALASRRRSPVLSILIALIVVALGAGAWLLRKSPSPATDTTVAQTDAARLAPAAAGAKPTAQAPAGANPRARPITPPAAVTKPAAAAAGNPLASVKPPSDAAHPPTRANPPLGDRPGSVAALPPALPAVAGPVAPPPGAVKPKEAAPTAPMNPAVADAKADAKPAEKAVVLPTETAATRPAPRPAQPALPSVWELSYALRKDLPEMSVTMHVYADDPAQRFVVIKGARHVEGDTIGDGVTLKQIRPDGMELEFKGTRFTYPRDGR